VLIDAKAFLRQGSLLPQSRRHTFIASLLGIPHVVAAVNKMDLAAYSRESFEAIRAEFYSLARQLGLKSVEAIPVSALEGDNVVDPSKAMTWYAGPTLLEYLETVPLRVNEIAGPMRFPVQLVQRPDANFRGFAGQVARGILRAGDRVMALPSRRETIVRNIVTYNGTLEAAAFPQSVTVELEDEIDLSRGEMLVAASDASAEPFVSTQFAAKVVWMHEEPLAIGRTYLAKHTTRTVRATVRSIRYKVDVASLAEQAATTVAMNEIAEVEFESNLPLFFDPYVNNRMMGSVILIDTVTNATVGAAMLTGLAERAAEARGATTRPTLLLLPGRADVALRIAEALGTQAVLIDDALIPDETVAAVVRALQLAKLTAVSARRLSADAIASIEAFAPGAVMQGDGMDEQAILTSLEVF
jgi:bifunctional enzyme CysN/CysC/sulfate adenylyltransferase subunit 1